MPSFKDYDIDDGEIEPHRKPKKKKVVSNSNWRDFRNKNKKSLAKDLIFDDVLVRVWSPEIEKEEEIKRGLGNLARYPDVYPYIAVMPDYHLGENSVNGSVIPSRSTLYVNAIGGDIGCGVASVKLPIDVDEIEPFLREIYKSIYEKIPTGKRLHIKPDRRVLDLPLFDSELDLMNVSNKKRAQQQIGTLGGGNHFVEIQRGEGGKVNVMVHTGSRGLGQIVREVSHRNGIKHDRPKGLVTLDADSDEGRAYLDNVNFAMRYAEANREEILREVFGALKSYVPRLEEISFDDILAKKIEVPHNFLSREMHFGEEVFIHRKGAIRVLEYELGLIPGSMGTHSYVVLGKGNKYSFNSCSHGAGRKMTRNEAKNRISRSDFAKAMGEVVSRKDKGVYDEAPQAYKDVEEVLSYQRDLVKRVEVLKPLISIK
jgi:tRNA-splicing ligase RtcB (3'-phosphate/5'-hydroxy nucleic acid ligase)